MIDRNDSRVIKLETEYLVDLVIRTRQCESACDMCQKGKANSRDLTALTLITSFRTPTMMTQLYKTDTRHIFVAIIAHSANY